MMECPSCGYDGLWVEYEKGQRVFYDQQDDLIDRDGLFAGYGPSVEECPECGLSLKEVMA